MMNYAFGVFGDKNSGKKTLIRALMIDNKCSSVKKLENGMITVTEYHESELLFNSETTYPFFQKPKEISYDISTYSINPQYEGNWGSIIFSEYDLLFYVIDVTKIQNKLAKIRDLEMLNRYNARVIFIFNKGTIDNKADEIIFANTIEQKTYDNMRQLISQICKKITYRIICANLLEIYFTRLIMFKPQLHDMIIIKLIEKNTIMDFDKNMELNGYNSLRIAMDEIFNYKVQYQLYVEYCTKKIIQSPDLDNILEMMKMINRLQMIFDKNTINKKNIILQNIKNTINKLKIAEQYLNMKEPVKIIKFVNNTSVEVLEKVIKVLKIYTLCFEEDEYVHNELEIYTTIILLHKIALCRKKMPNIINRYLKRKHKKCTCEDILISLKVKLFFTYDTEIVKIIKENKFESVSDICMKIIKTKLKSKLPEQKIYLANLIHYSRKVNSKYSIFFESILEHNYNFEDIDIINKNTDMEKYIQLEKYFMSLSDF